MNGKQMTISGFVNIDTLFDVLTAEQELNGVDSAVIEARYDKVTGRKLRKGEFSKNGEISSPETCKGCPKQEKQKINCFDTGIFGYQVDDGDDDGDGNYICEYCSKLGYTQKYKPNICDNCEECATCAEYNNGECDGCTFSIYRDGTPYSSKLSRDEILSKDDIDALDTLSDINRKDDTVRYPDDDGIHHFTVMDY